MDKANQHIDLLYRYIDGELDATQSLYVEQQLAENEEWQTVYEGLLLAEDKNIDTDAVLSKLEKRIDAVEQKQAEPKLEQAPIIPLGIRKWASIAAALAGFVLLSYAALQAINSGQFGNRASDHTVYSSRPSVYPEDQIMIIPRKKKVSKRTQEFQADEIEQIAAAQEAIIIDEPHIVATAQAEVAESESGNTYRIASEPLASLEVAQQGDQFSRPGSYSDLLERYGYRELNPDLLNTPRGAREISAPANHYKNFSRNAMSEAQLAAFKDEFEADYIARFPFSGLVKAEFIIDETGQPKNFKILESPSDDASEVAKILFFEKATWQNPLNSYEKAAPQQITGTVSFGNSIAIGVEFEE